MWDVGGLGDNLEKFSPAAVELHLLSESGMENLMDKVKVKLEKQKNSQKIGHFQIYQKICHFSNLSENWPFLNFSENWQFSNFSENWQFSSP